MTTLSALLFATQLWGASEANPVDLSKEILATREKIFSQEKESREAQGAMFALNKRIEASNKRRAELNQQRLRVRARAERLAMEIVDLQGRLKSLSQNAAKRLGAIYKFSDLGIMRLIFSGQDADELDRRIVYLRHILNQDASLMAELKQSKMDLEYRKSQLQSNVSKLAEIEKSIVQTEAQLEGEQKSKAAYISRLRQKNVRYATQLKNYRKLAAKKSVSVENEDIFNDMMTSLFERKGQLETPVQGQLSKTFGVVEDSIYRFKLHHKGLFFVAEPQSLVRTVHEGRVAFVGILDIYGQTIIVDHGDQYFTVYAHLGEVFVKPGVIVDANREIARIGEARGHKPAGLYFEIRHFSDAIDPLPWLHDQRLAKGDSKGKET